MSQEDLRKLYDHVSQSTHASYEKVKSEIEAKLGEAVKATDEIGNKASDAHKQVKAVVKEVIVPKVEEIVETAPLVLADVVQTVKETTEDIAEKVHDVVQPMIDNLTKK